MNKEVDIYTTIQGDMWDGISYKVYGKDNVVELVQANPIYSNIVIFSDGIDLICPDISSKSENTLPWR